MLEAYQKCIDGNNEEFDLLKDNKFYVEFYNRKKLLETNKYSSDKNIEGQKTQYQKNVDDMSNSIAEYEKQILKFEETKKCVKSRINTKGMQSYLWCWAKNMAEKRGS